MQIKTFFFIQIPNFRYCVNKKKVVLLHPILQKVLEE